MGPILPFLEVLHFLLSFASFGDSSVLRLSRLAPKPRHRTRPSGLADFASKELVCADYDVMSRLPRF